MAAVGNARISFTWTINTNNKNTYLSKTFKVCGIDNNHSICRLRLTRSPFEITLENIGNTNIFLGGEIQFFYKQSTVFISKFGYEEIANSNPLKWTINNQTMCDHSIYYVKLNLESCFIIVKDLFKDDNAAKTIVTPNITTVNAVKVTTDLEKLLTESKHSDVEIICSDGKILKCHKALLCARSPVLEAMFSNDFKEVSSGQIKLDYFDTEVVKDLLSYIYTGMPKHLEDNAEILLQAGEQFQMEALKEICGMHLIKKLTKDNVLEYLALGDKYRQQDLKKASLEMVVENAKDMKENARLTEFAINNPELIVEALSALAFK